MSIRATARYRCLKKTRERPGEYSTRLRVPESALQLLFVASLPSVLENPALWLAESTSCSDAEPSSLCSERNAIGESRAYLRSRLASSSSVRSRTGTRLVSPRTFQRKLSKIFERDLRPLTMSERKKRQAVERVDSAAFFLGAVHLTFHDATPVVVLRSALSEIPSELSCWCASVKSFFYRFDGRQDPVRSPFGPS